MRITTNGMFSNISESTSVHFNAISEQMRHSQYRVKESGDDPIAQGRIINLNRSINELKSYKTSAQVLQSELSGIESSVKSYSEIFNELNTLVEKVSSGSMNHQDLKQLSKHMGGMVDDIAQIFNMPNANGEYLYSGTATDKPPFEKSKVSIDIEGQIHETESWVYTGNNDNKLTKIGSSISLPSSVIGSELINADGSNLFETIAIAQHYLSQGLEIPDTELGKIEHSFSKLMDKRISFQSNLGHSYNSTNRNINMYQGMTDEYTRLLSNTEDADYISVASEIKKQQQIMKTLAQASKVLMDMASLKFD